MLGRIALTCSIFSRDAPIVDPDAIQMQGETDSASLGRYLDELVDLLPPLVRDGDCGAAVYDARGALLATSHSCICGAFPPRISIPPRGEVGGMVPEPSAISDGSGAMMVCTLVGGAEPESRYAFAVRASRVADPHVLQAACVLGSWFLARELDLIDQTRLLRQLAKEQQAIIDHISDGLLVVDRSGCVRYMNAPAGRILDLDPAASIGRRFRDLLDFEPIIEPIFATCHGYVNRELRIDSRRRRLHLIDTAIPITNDDGEVVSIVNTFREMARVRRLSQRMIGAQARYHFSDILGTSPAIRETVSAARRAARSDANVLLTGESGTGKELFAQAIHTDGRRHDGPFVAINCAALPRDLIESELFGYVAGSFTGADRGGRAGKFELASGGTIFLDEISEMPLDVQAKLLRVLQEREVTRIGGTQSLAIDVRIITATNSDLHQAVARKAFREDLYYRLNVIRIDIPPLRARSEDIEQLAQEFMRKSCATLQRPALNISSSARRQLRDGRWPGNVRQLQNVVERLVSMTDGSLVEIIPRDWLSEETSGRAQQFNGDAICSAVMSLVESERMCIRLALQETRCNVTRAAQILGITRPTLYSKMKRYGFSLIVDLGEAGPSDTTMDRADSRRVLTGIRRR